jgi:hypothetical protein
MEQTMTLTTNESGSTANNPAPSLSGAFRLLCRGSAWLTCTGMLMLADIAISLAGLATDPTLITGAPAWLKPLKFGLSTSLFCFTVAFMIGRLQRTRRFSAIVARFLAAALTVEIVLIDMQAARHTTSHFNYSSAFDASVFATMGLGIAVVFLSTVLLLVASCMERFPDRALGRAVRLSLLLALAGMGVGSLMTMPTPQQLAAQRTTQGRMPHIGAHTVGAPDGGAGLPLTGWSADHGDLRIAHFLGLHAMQVLLLAWYLAHRRAGWTERRQLRLIAGAGISVTIAFAVVLSQALRGEALLRPDTAIVAAWAAWLAVTAALLAWSLSHPNPAGHDGGWKLEANRG